MIVSKTPFIAMSSCLDMKLDGYKDINHQMHQLGATRQNTAVCKLCLDAIIHMQNVGMIWIATYS